MTPNEYRAALQKLGLSQRDAAEMLGISHRASHGYATNRPIPKTVAKLLRLIIRLDSCFNLKPDEI